MKNRLFLLLFVSLYSLAGYSQEVSKPAVTLLRYPDSAFSINTAFALVSAAVTYTGALWITRYHQFNNIDQWLIKSSPIVTDWNFFSFSGWKMNTYKKSSDIIEHEIRVNELLFSDDILTSHFNDIYTEHNNNSLETLETLFKSEKEKLEEKLDYVSSFTPLTQAINNALKKELNTQNKDPNNLVLLACQETITNTTADTIDDLKYLETTIDNSYEETSQRLTYKHYFIAQKFCNNEDGNQQQTIRLPWTIINFLKNTVTTSIANAHKATYLYYELLKRYTRLLALEKIVKKISSLD